MASGDATPIPVKNQAYRVTFPILDADGDLVTGAAALDSEISKDAGTFADCTNEATEIATSSGMYYLDLTATEMNADTVAIIVKTTTTGAKTTPIVLYPQEAGDIKVDVETISGDSTAADNAESFFDGTGYAGTGNTIPTVTTVTNQVTADVTAISGDTVAANNLEADYDGTGYAKANSTIGTCTTNTDMRGTDSALLASSAPTNFGDLSITATTGRVDVASIEGSDATDQINASCDASIETYGLDHLVSAAVIGTDVADNSIIARMAASGATADWDTFVNTTDSLQAIRDNQLAATPDVNVVQISGDSVAADNCEAYFDNTGFNASNSTIGTCTTNTDMRGTDSAFLAASAPTNFSDLSITATTGRVDVGSWLGTAVTTSSTTSKPEVDVNSISDDATAANNAELFFDGTGYAGGTTKLDVNIASSDDIDLTATQKTSVNSEVADVMTTDTLSELAQAAPPATPTFAEAVMAVYMALRNKVTVTSSSKKFHNDAGTNVFTKSLSDDGTTYTEDEAGAGS